jgi:hypothetical protein
MRFTRVYTYGMVLIWWRWNWNPLECIEPIIDIILIEVLF